MIGVAVAFALGAFGIAMIMAVAVIVMAGVAAGRSRQLFAGSRAIMAVFPRRVEDRVGHPNEHRRHRQREGALAKKE